MINKPTILFSLFIIFAAFYTPVFATFNFGANQKTNVLSIPITGIDNPTYITEPGSYRLTKDLADIPIIIQSSDVCILLNGFSLNITDTTVDAGIEIADDTRNVIIQGGEISGNSNQSGILVHGGCLNILIQNVKISSELRGISLPEAGISSFTSNVVINDVMISNCLTGIYAHYANDLRIYQAVISAGDIAESTPTTGIFLWLTWGTSIDSCTLTDIALGISAKGSIATTIKDSVIDSLRGTMFSLVDVVAGIWASEGTANVIDHCTINAIGGDTTGGAAYCDVFGIRLQLEESSLIKNCLINNLYPQATYTVGTEGIYIFDCTDCIIQDNTVSNLFGNSSGHSYAFDNAGTTSNVYIGNKAVNCQNAAMVPYTSNIDYVLSAPSTTTYTCPPNTSHGPSGFFYNWIIA